MTPKKTDEQDRATCRRCGWEQQFEERETYCRPNDVPHDYPPEPPSREPHCATCSCGFTGAL